MTRPNQTISATFASPRPFSIFITTAQATLIAAIFALITLASPGTTPLASAQGQAPQPYQVTSVELLARELDQNSAALIQAAREHARLTGDPAELARIARLEDLHQAAATFYRNIRVYANNPVHTETDFRNLRQAYEQARGDLGTFDWNPTAAGSARSFAAAMRTLSRYYAPLPTTVSGDEKVRRAAAEIARLTSHLVSDARGQQWRGLIDKRGYDRIEQLNAAAQRFYEVLYSYGYDSPTLREAYMDLVHRLQEARDVAGDFNLNFQQRLGTVWDLASQINFIYPSVPLGSFDIQDFHR